MDEGAHLDKTARASYADCVTLKFITLGRKGVAMLRLERRWLAVFAIAGISALGMSAPLLSELTCSYTPWKKPGTINGNAACVSPGDDCYHCWGENGNHCYRATGLCVPRERTQ